MQRARRAFPMVHDEQKHRADKFLNLSARCVFFCADGLPPDDDALSDFVRNQDSKR